MNHPKRTILQIFFILAALQLSISTTQAAEPYPLEYWALRNVVSNVQVSPDGRYLSLLKIARRDANPVLEIYDASDLEKKPFVLNADPMEITTYRWVGNQSIVVQFRQKVRDRIEGFNQGVYEGKLALLDVKKEKIKEFREVNPSIDSLLPDKPDKIILSYNPQGGGSRQLRLPSNFRPRSYYEFDLKKGTKRLLIQGQISLAQVQFNKDGEPLFASGYDRGAGEYVWYYRKAGTKDWVEIYRLHEDSFESFRIGGLDPQKPDTLLVIAHNGRDKTALWEFDLKTNTFGEIAYARSDVNVGGVVGHSNRWTEPDTIVGVSYATDRRRVEYFDAVEGATYAQLEQLIPHSHSLYITSRSRDGQTLTVYNSGPRDPGTYFLIKDGRLRTIGSTQPLLESENLADVRYINYKARDGRTIYGFITVPKGEPPFPLVVMPHGGPFVSEIVGYDEWGQMLANNGYMVLQPQYRGSTNFGLEYYTSAFREGGQGGYSMQDDKDDGALHLVKEGLVDADRIAMFGWSYGGYAALVAAARTPQIHQCVIAGAAVSDTLRQVTYYEQRMRGAQREEQMRMWADSVSPVDVANMVNVPLLLIHGSVDQRVPPEHQRRYRDALDRNGKAYKFVELEGADHFSNTLFYEHQLLLYRSIIDFLAKDCGPDGL